VSYWGGLWGGGSDAVGALWVRINRDVPIIGHVGDIIELYHTRWISVAQQIEGAFDLNTAVGYSLDLWGELLGVKRLGLSDTDYRRILLVQAVLILAGAATRSKAIAVFERWTGVAADEYRGAGRTIEIGGNVPAAYEARLLRLLRRAAPAARRVRVYSITSDDLVSDYGLDPTGTTTITDYGLDPVTDPAPTAEPIQ
jgi:hypothetical protein